MSSRRCFPIPALGTLAYESARYQDYNLLMVLCILTGAVVILCSIAGAGRSTNGSTRASARTCRREEGERT